MADSPVTAESVNPFYNEVSHNKPDEISVDSPATVSSANQISEPVQQASDNSSVDAMPNNETVTDDTGQADGPGPGSEEEIIQYLELDGKEYPLDDVRKWQSGHMMQKDYTKKTMTLAEERKQHKAITTAERDQLQKDRSEISEMTIQLKAIVVEDEEINWIELKEDDPEKYIELKERADKRKAMVDKIKADSVAVSPDDPAAIMVEKEKLFAANPDWMDSDNKPTETYTSDIALMNEYAGRAGFSIDEFNQMTQSHYIITVLKAAKYDQLQDKGRKIKQKRENVPIITKPRGAKTPSQDRSFAETFYGSD